MAVFAEPFSMLKFPLRKFPWFCCILLKNVHIVYCLIWCYIVDIDIMLLSFYFLLWKNQQKDVAYFCYRIPVIFCAYFLPILARTVQNGKRNKTNTKTKKKDKWQKTNIICFSISYAFFMQIMAHATQNVKNTN